MRFQIEAVMNLRQNLQKIGSQLLVGQGNPSDFIQKLVQGQQTQIVYTQETCTEELQTENRVGSLQGVKMVPVWNSTLLHCDDLPTFKKFPTSYTAFRQLTAKVDVRPLAPTLKSLPYIPDPSFQQAEAFIPKLP